ncbi:hypothetical protein K474DRAFT_1667301 [Panus rudis PR-1116 ss-1]|nr:hypothetical protein K474DRAFT_1667301 [Panus rudis PR-1116 ss-1]
MADAENPFLSKPPPPTFQPPSLAPRLQLITPSASPPASRSRPSSKRPRLTPTTPSSNPNASSRASSSVPRSTPSDNAQPNLDEAWQASAKRVWDVWSQLAERYSRPLDEDDIVNLRDGSIIRDKGALRSVVKVKFGALTDADEGAATQGGEEAEEGEEEEEEDTDEIDAFAREEGGEVKEGGEEGDISAELKGFKTKMQLLMNAKPIGPEDDDLKAFLEAERRRREIEGDEEDEEDDVRDRRLTLASGPYAEDEDDGYTSFENDPLSEPDYRPPLRSPSPKRAASVPPRAKLRPPDLFDDDSSEDELATWDFDPDAKTSKNPETPKTPKTPRRQSRQPTEPRLDIIDLTSPSPSPPSSPRTPQRSRARSKSRRPSPTVAAESRPQHPRAKSKTPAPRRIKAISPPRASSSAVQLQTPPLSSESQVTPFEDADVAGPSSFMDFSTPQNNVASKSSDVQSQTQSVRPGKERASDTDVLDRVVSPDEKREDSSGSVKRPSLTKTVSLPQIDALQITTPKKPRPTPTPRQGRMMVEVVVSKGKSRAPSKPPPISRNPSPLRSSQQPALDIRMDDIDKVKLDLKGKGKDTSGGITHRAAGSRDSDSTRPSSSPRGKKPSRDISDTPDPAPRTPKRTSGGSKRKRVVSSSESSAGESSPRLKVSSSARSRSVSRVASSTIPSGVKPKARRGRPPGVRPTETGRPHAEEKRKGATEIPNGDIDAGAQSMSMECSPAVSSEQKRGAYQPPSSAAKSSEHAHVHRQGVSHVAEYPYPPPYTPQHQHRQGRDSGKDTKTPRRHSRSRSQEHPSYTPLPPPNIPINHRDAHYHYAQAVQHLYLMTGVLPPPGGTPGPLPGFPVPFPWLPHTPTHHHRQGRSQFDSDAAPSSSPVPGSSRSNSVASFSTPTHVHGSYPYMFDPMYSNGTLPPSSSPPSSPSPEASPPKLKPAIRARSQSRGRRVSFKLDGDDRPSIRPGTDEEDEEGDEEDGKRKRAVHSRASREPSPEVPLPDPVTPPPDRGRARTPRSRGKSLVSEQIEKLIAEDEEEMDLLRLRASERGRTPGLPERGRSRG